MPVVLRIRGEHAPEFGRAEMFGMRRNRGVPALRQPRPIVDQAQSEIAVASSIGLLSGAAPARTFEQAFIVFMKRHNIEVDPKYLWG